MSFVDVLKLHKRQNFSEEEGKKKKVLHCTICLKPSTDLDVVLDLASVVHNVEGPLPELGNLVVGVATVIVREL